MQRSTLLVSGLACLAVACLGTDPAEVRSDAPPTWRYVPDLSVTPPPYSKLVANYKERIEQPYVFVELRGNYVATGRALPELHTRLHAAGVEVVGPPFALFYDDPGHVPLGELRSRACFPVEAAPEPETGLDSDVLAATTVVYAVVSGPYPGVPRAYPGLFAFAGTMGWVENGPVREIYLTSPAAVASYDELLCEIQLPVTQRR
jgi:effector-binding domain-containing protein